MPVDIFGVLSVFPLRGSGLRSVVCGKHFLGSGERQQACWLSSASALRRGAAATPHRIRETLLKA